MRGSNTNQSKHCLYLQILFSILSMCPELIRKTELIEYLKGDLILYLILYLQNPLDHELGYFSLKIVLLICQLYRKQLKIQIEIIFVHLFMYHLRKPVKHNCYSLILETLREISFILTSQDT